MGPIARALAVAAMVTIAVAGCGSAVGSPAAPSEQASCAPGDHAVVGRVNPLGECYPDVLPTPISSCPPGERLVAGRVNPNGECLPAFSP